jgi:hypothetical protein
VKGYPRHTKVISVAINVATSEVNAQQRCLSSCMQEDQFKKLIKKFSLQLQAMQQKSRNDFVFLRREREYELRGFNCQY